MALIAKKPSDCSPAEIAAFKELLLRGDEVEEAGLDNRIAAALCLVFYYIGSSELVGIGALKVPSGAHKRRVFTSAGSPDKGDDFPFELGWLFVDETHRGKGLSRQLAEEALKLSQGKGVFATTRLDNNPMCRTNVRIGFRRSGNPYRTTRPGRSHSLSLFVRP